MKLVYYNLNLVLDIKEGAVNSIVLESPEWLERFIMDLQDSIENGAEEVALYNSQDDPIDLHRKCELIISPFDLTFDKKEIQRKLFQELQSTILDENFIEDFSRIQSEIIQLLDRMGEASDYGLDFEAELDLPALFRMYHLHIQDPQGHFDEKLIEYIVTMKKLTGKQVFALANCEAFLAESSYRYLEECAAYYDLSLLFISNRQIELLKDKNTYIIDMDLCELH